MYLEKRLEQLATENPEIKELFGIWCVMKKQFTQMLDGVTQYFPHFSLHNESHSKTIAQQIERVIGLERINQLSASDLWLLLMSFYSHDIGMAIKYEEIYKFFVSNECGKNLNEYAVSKNKNVAEAAARLIGFGVINKIDNFEQSIQHFNDIRLIIETHFRAEHALRSKNYIDLLMEGFNQYSIINIRFSELLGRICIAHQQNICKIAEIPFQTNGLVGDYAHPRFIAAMLCLGDLLDLDTDRFNESMLEVIDPLPQSSKVHLLKHKAIKQFLINSEGIEIISDTENDEVNRELKTWTQYLKGTVEYLCLNWDNIAPKDFGTPPRIKGIKHFKNGNENWAAFLSLAFTISKNRAIELLQGANIYNNKFVFVREVIQNSIDASALQMWYELYNTNPDKYNSNTKITEVDNSIFEKFSIDVNLMIDDNGFCVVTIQDKGIGIDAKDLDNISKVGDSNINKKANIIDNMPNWLKPSGAFGLGLQSIFMITDAFEVISKTENDKPKIIKFESGNNNFGYISVGDYKEHFPRGTKTTIKIDSTKIKQNDFNYGNIELILKYRTIEFLIAQRIYNNFFRFHNWHDFKKCYEYAFFNINFQTNITEEKNVLPNLNGNALFDKIFKSDSEIDEQHDFSFSYYDNDFDALCEISINKPISKNMDNNIQFSESNRKFNNAIYFRNAYIDDYNIKDYFQDNLFKYINFSINILSYKSDDLLNINRKSFTDEGRLIVIKLIDDIVKKALKKYISKLLISSVDINEYGICLYQICKFLQYKENEFKNKFFDTLSKYNYGAFSLFDSDNSKKQNVYYSFSELLEKQITVIVKKHNKNVFGETLYEILPSIDNITEAVENENIVKYHSKNVISNYISERCFLKYNEFVYECFKIKPLIIADLHLSKYDKCYKINSFLNAIMGNEWHRIIDGQKDYEDLSLIEGENQYASYSIELPFGVEDFELLKISLLSRESKKFKKENFLSKLKEGKYFQVVVSYISEKNNKPEEDIKTQMLKLLDEMITLLFVDDVYKHYVQKLVSNPSLISNIM